MPKNSFRIPAVNMDGHRPWIGRHRQVTISEISQDISDLLETIDSGTTSENSKARLRSYLYAHYHPEFKTSRRVIIYQTVKSALENSNLSHLKNIAGIKQKSAYINTILNVGKRSSYFGGLIGVTVAGYFFLPPIIKWGILPIAKQAIRNLVPNQRYLTPIDNYLKLSRLIGKSPTVIYSGIRKALGPEVGHAGKPVPKEIDTTPLDDLIGNLFFRWLIELSNFSDAAKNDLRQRAEIAFIYDMARVSRQLEGLAQTPEHCWDRISHYTNFGMFLKSMESPEVPIHDMLRTAVEIISRANPGRGHKNRRFYAELERGLKNLNYTLEVVEPLDRFNEKDEFDDIETPAAKLAFFAQNRNVLERLYIGHDTQLAGLTNMFQDFQQACLLSNDPTALPKQIRTILVSYKKSFKELGKVELDSYREEVRRLSSHG